jgi:hypothetical protein
MIIDTQIKFLDISKIQTLHDSNNCIVSFMNSTIEPVIIAVRTIRGGTSF